MLASTNTTPFSGSTSKCFFPFEQCYALWSYSHSPEPFRKISEICVCLYQKWISEASRTPQAIPGAFSTHLGRIAIHHPGRWKPTTVQGGSLTFVHTTFILTSRSSKAQMKVLLGPDAGSSKGEAGGSPALSRNCNRALARKPGRPPSRESPFTLAEGMGEEPIEASPGSSARASLIS